MIAKTATWVDRLYEERTQLEGKIRRLGAFQKSEEYDALPVHDRNLLGDQYMAMTAYYDILNERIISLAP